MPRRDAVTAKSTTAKNMVADSAKAKPAKAPSAATKKPADRADGAKSPLKQADGASTVKAGKVASAARGRSAAAKEKPAKEKPVKIKLVRDSFTMPESEYAVLGEVKKECLKNGIAVKKSELLRVGVSLVRALAIDKLQERVAALPVLKAGRPKKTK